MSQASFLMFSNFQVFKTFLVGSQLLSDIQTFFSWEPALETLNSQDDDVDVKKNPYPFSPINNNFCKDMKTKVVQHVPSMSQHSWFPAFV